MILELRVPIYIMCSTHYILITGSDSFLSPVSMSVSPVHDYIGHLKSHYSSRNFPGFSKETLRVKPEGFIHLNLVSIEKIDVEDCATSFLTNTPYLR